MENLSEKMLNFNVLNSSLLLLRRILLKRIHLDEFSLNILRFFLLINHSLNDRSEAKS